MSIRLKGKQLDGINAAIKADDHNERKHQRLVADEVLKRCDGCSQVVKVQRKLTNHGRLKSNGAGEFFPCGRLHEVGLLTQDETSLH